MSKNNMLDASVLSASTQNVKSVLNVKSVVTSACVCLVALCLFFLSSVLEDKSSSLYFGFITVAVLLLILGFYRLLNKRMQAVYEPTKSVMMEGSFYLDILQLDELKGAVTKHPETDFSKFVFVRSGNTRMDYVVSRDANFVAVQIYQYIPYNFEPATQVVCYEGKAAQNLALFILKNHEKLK